MSEARRQVTTVVGSSGHKTRELVPMREEVFSSADLETGAGTQRALQIVQRHIAEATQAARSLPVQGGAYHPSLTFVANAKTTILHHVPGGFEVAWLPLSMRPANTGTAVAVSIVEVSQDASRGRIVLAASANCVSDVWFFARPAAEGP